MGVLNKIIDHASKFTIIIAGLVIALLPLVFLFGN
jgi:hypothetical protein